MKYHPNDGKFIFLKVGGKRVNIRWLLCVVIVVVSVSLSIFHPNSKRNRNPLPNAQARVRFGSVQFGSSLLFLSFLPSLALWIQ